MSGREGPSRRILVVDDEPAITKLLRRVLEGEGHEVAVAADGQGALDRLSERRPDLVGLDLDMPRLGGLEVCRRLKAAPETRLLPVLVLTGTRLRAWGLSARTLERVARSYVLADPVVGVGIGIGPTAGRPIPVAEMDCDTGVMQAIGPGGRFVLDCESSGIAVQDTHPTQPGDQH